MLELWQQWLRATGAAPGTIRTRLRSVSALLSHSRRDDPVQLTTEDVIGWLADCHKAWTRRTYWYSAAAWFTWLVEQGLRSDNPMARIPRPRPPRSVPRPVPDAVVERLLSDPGSVRAYEYTVLAVLAGLRVGEVAKVHGQDVDRAANTLFVLGKGGREAFLPLHPRIAMLARGKPSNDYWFRGSDEGHVQARSVSHTLSRALAAAGAPESTPHCLRHSYGTAILRRSHDLRLTQELMRHGSPASTAVYTEVSRRDKVAAISSLPWVG